MKFFDQVKRSNKSLWRSKLRTFLTVGAIFIGAATLSLTLAIGEGVRKFINDQVSTIAADGVLTIQKVDFSGVGGGSVGNTPAEYEPEKVSQNGIQYFSQEDVEKVKTVDEIEKVIPYYLIIPEYITTSDAKKYVITITSNISELRPALIAGAYPADDQKDYIILPYNYLEVLKFGTAENAIDKKVTVAYKNVFGEIKEKELTVKAVQINAIVNNGQAYVSMDDAKEISDFQSKNTPLENMYAAIIAIVDKDASKEKLDSIKAKLQVLGFSAMTVEDQLQTINGIISAVQIVLSAFAVIAILVSTFGIVNTLLMSVYERTKEIGLFRALGMSRVNIFSMFAIEAGSIGFWGGLFGVIFGYLIGQLINWVVAQSELFGFEGFNLLVFPLPYMIAIILGLVLVSLLSGVLPARKAANLDPIEALRYE